tara:strand:- start:162 stop:416 length:255 start_codon:yes stop_codon:yes gene_type:complete
MGLFLRIEAHSNILGSTEKNVTYIALSQITSVSSNSNGGSTVVFGTNQEVTVPELSPDELLQNNVQSLVPNGIGQDLNIVVNNS